MNKKFLKNIEWSVLIYALILFVIGLFALYSATYTNGLGEYNKQVTFGLISIPILIVFTLVDYKKIAKYSIIYYIISLLLLVGVLSTNARNGSSSWFEFGELSLQPAEFAKIFTIIFVSDVIMKLQLKGIDEINKIHKLIVPIILFLIPIGLIIRQPDYGTATAFLVAMITIIFVGGIRKRYTIPVIVLILSGIYALWVYIIPTYAPHILNRINVFLNPGLDPRGAGYNIIQSKLAIGSGHVFGMGFRNGTQAQLGYLHPKTTDFIFSMISEELGFIISGAIIVLYVLLITKGIQIAKTAKDNLGTYIATGIIAVFLYHMFENIGMTMGILPITGIPLPFVSYGGSSLITNFIAIALLLNISGRRQKAKFVDEDENKNNKKRPNNININSFNNILNINFKNEKTNNSNDRENNNIKNNKKNLDKINRIGKR